MYQIMNFRVDLFLAQAHTIGAQYASTIFHAASPLPLVNLKAGPVLSRYNTKTRNTRATQLSRCDKALFSLFT
jgi:hypothetical protein